MTPGRNPRPHHVVFLNPMMLGHSPRQGIPLVHVSAQPEPFWSVSRFVSSLRRVMTHQYRCTLLTQRCIPQNVFTLCEPKSGRVTDPSPRALRMPENTDFSQLSGRAIRFIHSIHSFLSQLTIEPFCVYKEARDFALKPVCIQVEVPMEQVRGINPRGINPKP